MPPPTGHQPTLPITIDRSYTGTGRTFYFAESANNLRMTQRRGWQPTRCSGEEQHDDLTGLLNRLHAWTDAPVIGDHTT